MKSAWMVSSQYIDGVKLYSVYRLRDVEETDHSGNREASDRLFEDRESAVEYAQTLDDREGEQ